MPDWLVLGPAPWIVASILLFPALALADRWFDRRDAKRADCQVYDLNTYRDRASFR